LGRPDAEYALVLLEAACREAEGASESILRQRLAVRISDAGTRDEKLRYLVDVLRNDGYLIEHGGRWRFQFPLLREYWVRRVAPREGFDGK
jgi:hypothetical protein